MTLRQVLLLVAGLVAAFWLGVDVTYRPPAAVPARSYEGMVPPAPLTIGTTPLAIQGNGTTGTFLRGDGTWSVTVEAGGGGGGAGHVGLNYGR